MSEENLTAKEIQLEEESISVDGNPGDLVPQPIDLASMDMIPAGTTDAQALRILAELRESNQRSRIAFGNRVAAIERGDDKASPIVKELYKLWGDHFYQMEMDAEEQLLEIANNIEIITHASTIKGLGVLTAAKIVSQINIHEAGTVSALWRYAGYGVGKYWADKNGMLVAPLEGTHWTTEGGVKVKRHEVVEGKPGWTMVESRDRNLEGWLSPYNRRLKTYLYLAAQGFLRCRSPYSLVYYQAKSHYMQTHPDWLMTPAGKKVRGGAGHVHSAAMRKMIKVFLAHLWEQWRELEGLPLRPLYVHEKLDHATKYERAEFDSPVIKKPES